MIRTSWPLVGAVVAVLVLSGGTVAVDEASIESVEVVEETDDDGDGAVSAFNLRITADTNCVGCNDESDDDPNIEPRFVVTLVGEGGNEVELDATETLENEDDLVYVYEIPDTIVRQFDTQTLEAQVVLKDYDPFASDELDEATIHVAVERDEQTPTETGTPTSTPVTTPTETDTPTETSRSSSDDQSAEVTFESQRSNGTAVTVESLVSPEGGFVLVYDTTMAAPLGNSAFVGSGRQGNVTVSFNRLLTDDQPLVAIAFRDTNGNQQFDPGTDEIYLAEGQPVIDSAEVNVTSN